MFNVLLLEATATTGGRSGGSFTFLIVMILMFVLMYFLTIRPQRKQQKKDQEMRDSTQVGDEITTIGGIMGRVVTVKEDSLIIETGADRNKMKIARWAIQTNNTANEKLEKQKEEKAAKKNKKDE